jgi:biopolymer transport protein ExbD
MIDCVFQLLLFFLLTPAFAANEGYLTTNLPQVGGRDPRPGPHPEAVRVVLEASGPRGENVTIVLKGIESLGDNFQGLQAALEAYRAQGLAADHPVLIAPDAGVRHRWVVRAMDAAVGARFTNIQFAVPDERSRGVAPAG